MVSSEDECNDSQKGVYGGQRESATRGGIRVGYGDGSIIGKAGAFNTLKLGISEMGMDVLEAKIVDGVTVEACGCRKVGFPAPAVVDRGATITIDAFGVGSGEGARVEILEACFRLIGAIDRQKLTIPCMSVDCLINN